MWYALVACHTAAWPRKNDVSLFILKLKLEAQVNMSIWSRKMIGQNASLGLVLLCVVFTGAVLGCFGQFVHVCHFVQVSLLISTSLTLRPMQPELLPPFHSVARSQTHNTGDSQMFRLLRQICSSPRNHCFDRVFTHMCDHRMKVLNT